MIDSHCHIDFDEFDHDRDVVMSRCQALGVAKLLVPGVSAKRWKKQVEIAKQYDELHLALGLHPYFLSEYHNEHLHLLASFLQDPTLNIVALGEVGLDFAIEQPRSLQMGVLTQQLELAQQYDLPVILHHRRSHNELIKVLKETPIKRGGVVHAFSGSLQQAETYVDLGFKIGVGGGLTYQRASKLRSVITKLPISALVLETDSPDMPVSGKQGQRNSPEYLPLVAKTLADLRQVPIQTISLETDHNFNQLFFDG